MNEDDAGSCKADIIEDEHVSKSRREGATNQVSIQEVKATRERLLTCL